MLIGNSIVPIFPKKIISQRTSEEALIPASAWRKAKPIKPKTTKVDHAAKHSANKLESQHASRFKETLVADITYIRTKEGWLYLAVVMDLFSRTIIGHQTASAMPAEIVTWSLEQGVSD